MRAKPPHRRVFMQQRHDLAGLPSMEPRLRSRGSPPVVSQEPGSSALQWSRGCEAAEARYLGLTNSASPTFNGAAAAKPRKLGGVLGADDGPVPSMEPRLRSRGSLHKRRRHREELTPSMEPRLRSRGSWATHHGEGPG